MQAVKYPNCVEVTYVWSLGDAAQVLLRRSAEVDGGDVGHGVPLGLSHEEEVQGDALVPQRLDVHDGAEEVLAEPVVQQDLPLGTERTSFISIQSNDLILSWLYTTGWPISLQTFYEMTLLMGFCTSARFC